MNRHRIALSLSTAALSALLVSSFATGQEIAAENRPHVAQLPLEQYRAAAVERWSEEIAALEARDQLENHPDDSILFIGSSSIRLWSDIATDMAPYHPIQRGYGGARWTDVAIFAERLIVPHKFRAVIFFVGNDITGGADDRTPAEVANLFAYVLQKVRAHSAEVPVFYVAVTPTESRFGAWPEIRRGNAAVRQLCERSPQTYFIGTESLYLDAQGHPRPELFVADKLHLSRAGYALWSAAIKSHLDTVLGGSE